jgi:hypothetical protein
LDQSPRLGFVCNNWRALGCVVIGRAVMSHAVAVLTMASTVFTDSGTIVIVDGP